MFKRKHYKFTDKKSSGKGMISTALFVCTAAMIIYGIWLSFRAHGMGGTIVGAMGTGGFVLSFIGLLLGVGGLKDENVFHTFSWIGAVGNAILWFAILVFIMIGI